VVERLVSDLVRDAQTRERGMRLFRKVWLAFPQQRAELIGNFGSDDLWKLPEIYDYAREALIPAPGQKVVARWAGLECACNCIVSAGCKSLPECSGTP